MRRSRVHLLGASGSGTTTLARAGVAFSGCTLPGADHPLFQVPAGRMALGLGIHGEPGLSEVPLTDADGVADLLVDGLFAERAPEPERRVAVVLNGLGGTKYDELFVLYRRVRQRLHEAGMHVVAPVVGEQVTSLDMAGVSLSLGYLDEELEALWLAPARAAAFVRGSVAEGARRSVRVESDEHGGPVTAASPASTESARSFVDALGRAAAVIEREAARLGAMDAVAGDGDHGIGMLRGIRAAHVAAGKVADAGGGLSTSLKRAGDAWSDVGGGTSGALWGAGLRAAADALDDESTPQAVAIVAAVQAYRDAVLGRGKAEPGDKTMVDAIMPFVDAIQGGHDAAEPIEAAWRRAADAARHAADETATIVARRGRSRTHGDRSLGTPDPGAVSFALVVDALAW